MIKQKILPGRTSPSKFYVLKPEYVETFKKLLDQDDEQYDEQSDEKSDEKSDMLSDVDEM